MNVWILHIHHDDHEDSLKHNFYWVFTTEAAAYSCLAAWCRTNWTRCGLSHMPPDDQALTTYYFEQVTYEYAVIVEADVDDDRISSISL